MNHARAIVPITATLALLVTGCKETAPTDDTSSGPPAQATSPAVNESALSVALHTPSEVKAGDAVPLLLVLRNVSREPVHVGTGDSTTTFDIRVKDRSGAVVWNRMHGRESLLSLREYTLSPGQELRFTDTWNQRSNDGMHVPDGTYHVQSTLDTQGDTDLETAPARLVILAQL